MNMFKKYFKKYSKDSKDSEDIEDLKERLNRQQEKLDSCIKRISDVERKNNELKRILENYIPGKITYKNEPKYLKMLSQDRIKYCHLYKDGKEFCINDLNLTNPTFSKGDGGNQENVVYANDVISTDQEIKDREYVIDLNSRTYIRTK